MTARTRAATRLLISAGAATLLVTACTVERDTSEPPETNPPPVVTEPTTAPASPTAEPTTGSPAPTDLPTAEETAPSALPPFGPADTLQTSEPSGEPLLPVDVRVGDHEGYDRVVVDLVGEGVPGWRAEYVSEAIEDGRGDRIEVDGDAILSIDISGTRYPEEGEEHYVPRGPVEGLDIVEEVHYVGTFEGLTQVFIGVDDGRADFRVLALAEPPRLVVDIADPED